MKTLFQLFIILLFSSQARAQYVTIPDSNFVAFLTVNYPLCMNGNQMDTTCSDIINDSYLNCSYRGIQNLTGMEYFDSLKTLDCRGNQLTSLPSLPASLTTLYSGGNQLMSLPTLPASLTTLDCGDNQLSSLPTLPASLTTLDCGGNQLSSLPTLPTSLDILYCYSNLLTSLPALPDSLATLYCGGNQLTSLPTLPSSLTVLSCMDNQLTSLPSLPSLLTHLNSMDNQLTSLPSLPTSLESLYCGSNQFISLPPLPISLSLLSCINSILNSLPALPASLVNLLCGGNQLTSLPTLPASLASLNCLDNQLTSLPTLPASLRFLDCRYNQLSTFPQLPDTLSFINTSFNPDLKCLSGLKVFTGPMNNFNISNTGISCLPNVIQHTGSIPAIDTMPVCDLFNPNGCPVGWNIQGTISSDPDVNCASDDGMGIPLVKMNLYNSITLLQQMIVNWIGQYSFDAGTGSYIVAVDTAGLPYDVLCPMGNSYSFNLTAVDSIEGDLDFKLICKPGFDVGASAVSIVSGVVRPGNTAAVDIHAGDMSNRYNMACASGIVGSVTVVINGPASYVSSVPGSLTPSVNGDTLIYTITDFGTVDFQIDFGIIIQTDTTAQLGQQVCFEVIVDPIAGDNNSANNTLSHCFEVVNSFDPNDKQVYPSGNIDPSQEWLTYTIRFQNTGNAPAQHIYIVDTLDINIDESTFQLLAYSHEPLVQIIGKKLLFNFPNINLPDSVSNEPGSHGYVQYKVKLNDNVSVGTTISNTAYIYFDFNAPVVTNTTLNTLTVVSSNEIVKSDVSFTIYPNPITNTTELKFIANGDLINGRLHISDSNGRLIYSTEVNKASIIQQVLKAGLYHCILEHDGGRVARKLVVME